jgi:hypothetical protein
MTHLDGSSEEELTAFYTGKPAVKRNALGETPEEERRRIEIEKRAEARVQEEAAKRAELEGAREREKSALLMQIGVLQEDVKVLEEQVNSLEAEKTQFEKQPHTIAMAMSSQQLRIKVLSGNGKMKSAKKMASRLKNIGFEVERLDLAPSTGFPADVVFYSRNSVDTAEALAEQLGPGTRIKPLTWKSVFDMIVVTRNERLR